MISPDFLSTIFESKSRLQSPILSGFLGSRTQLPKNQLKMGDCSRDLLSKMALKKAGEIIGPTSKKSTRSCGPNFIKFQKVDFLRFFVGKKVENQTKCPVWLPNWTLCQVFDLFSDKKSQKIHFLEFYKIRTARSGGFFGGWADDFASFFERHF